MKETLESCIMAVLNRCERIVFWVQSRFGKDQIDIAFMLLYFRAACMVALVLAAAVIWSIDVMIVSILFVGVAGVTHFQNGKLQKEKQTKDVYVLVRPRRDAVDKDSLEELSEAALLFLFSVLLGPMAVAGLMYAWNLPLLEGHLLSFICVSVLLIWTAFVNMCMDFFRVVEPRYFHQI